MLQSRLLTNPIASWLLAGAVVVAYAVVYLEHPSTADSVMTVVLAAGAGYTMLVAAGWPVILRGRRVGSAVTCLLAEVSLVTLTLALLRDSGLNYSLVFIPIIIQAILLPVWWRVTVWGLLASLMASLAVVFQEDVVPQGALVQMMNLLLVGFLAWLTLREETTRSQAELLAGQLANRTRELTAILDVTRSAVAVLDLEVLFNLILDRLKPIIDYSGAAIFRVSGPNHLELLIYRGPIPQRELRRKWTLDGDRLNGRVIQTRHPVIVPDIHRDLDSLHTAGEHARYLACWMGVPLVVRDEVIGMLTFDHTEPGYYTEAHAALALAFANQAAVALENARLYQEEHERRRESEQRRRVAEGLRDILNALNSKRDLNELLDYILEQAVQVLSAGAAAIYQLEPEEDALSIRAARGLAEQVVQRITVPVGRGLVGRAVQERQPIYVGDVRSESSGFDLHHDPNQRDLVDQITQKFPAIIAVPLCVRETIYGGMVLYYPEARAFRREEIDLVMAFADQVALAIANARLRAQAEQSAAAGERQRLARELHDAVTQTLFSANLIAEVLPQLWEQNPVEGQKRLADLRRLARGALAEMRTLLLELRPAALVETPLPDLIRQLVEATTARTRLAVTLDIQGKAILPPDVQTTFYRVAQEALNNVVKHAKAEHLDVRLICAPGAGELQLSDDGRGFDPAQIPRDHFGVQIMRERAGMVSAALEIESTVGSGTRITLAWEAEDDDTDFDR